MKTFYSLIIPTYTERSNLKLNSNKIIILLEDKVIFWKQQGTVSSLTAKPKFSGVSGVAWLVLLNCQCLVIKLVIFSIFEEVSLAVRILHCSVEIVRDSGPVAAIKK